MSRVSRDAGFTADHETVMEVCYNAQLTPFLAVAPSLEIVRNPGGDGGVSPAVVMGLCVGLGF